jgi:hypothetical protein
MWYYFKKKGSVIPKTDRYHGKKYNLEMKPEECIDLKYF